MDHIGVRRVEPAQPRHTIWKGLERGLGRAELLAELCAEYEVDREMAEAELDGLLRSLAQRELLVPATEPEARSR